MKPLYKRLIFSLSFFLIFSFINAQEPIFNINEATVAYFNPFYKDNNPFKFNAGLTYLNQTDKLSRTFNSYLLNACFGRLLIGPSANNKVGLTMLYDRNEKGENCLTNIHGYYGQNFYLADYFYCTAGAYIGIINQKLNVARTIDRFNSYSIFPDTFILSHKEAFDFGAAFFLQGDLVAPSFGVSADHINRPVEYKDDYSESRLPVKYSFFYKQPFYIRENRFSAQLLFQNQNKRCYNKALDNYLYDPLRYFSINLDYYNSFLIAGISYRYLFEKHAGYGTTLGFRIVNYRFFYTFTLSPEKGKNVFFNQVSVNYIIHRRTGGII